MSDYTTAGWAGRRYARFDLTSRPLELDINLSGVPCGCLACVYLVAMADPDASGSRYCVSV